MLTKRSKIRVIVAKKSENEKLLDVRRKINEAVATMAVPKNRERRRQPRRVAVIVLK